MKGHIRLIGALLVGIAVIAGGFYLRGTQDKDGTEGGGEIVVTKAPQRGYIEVTDSDGDGVMDWEEQLGMRVIEVVEEPQAAVLGEAASIEPTTYTDKFARSFFEDYVSSKSTGALPQTEEQFLQASISAIENTSQAKFYSRNDINVIEDTDFRIREYGNQIAEVANRHSIDNESEVVILSRALEANDPELLNDLKPIRDAYDGVIHDSLQVSVPESLADEHLDLINSYQSILTDIEAMQAAFSDPLYTLARMKRYEDDARGLLYSFQGILESLKDAGASYANDEPGSFFYYFDI